MIVQCPSCASRYRIRDANIPPTGGKIRCPSCSHSFIVYPETADDEDRTSITSQGDLSQLVNKMGPSPTGGTGLAADDEDYVSTQIATSDAARAAAVAASERGNPLDMDGTVEIQNPMEVWKEAQGAIAASRAAAAAAAEDDDEYEDHAPTEVIDPSAVTFALPGSSVPKPGPTVETSRDELDAVLGMGDDITNLETAVSSGEHLRGASPPPQPYAQQQPRRDAGFDSGYNPNEYAPNTPPGGRHTNEAWDQPQQDRFQPPQNPQQQQRVQQPSGAQDYHAPSGSGPHDRFQQPSGPNSFARSPSGLTSSALFDDVADDESAGAPPPYTTPAAYAAPGGAPMGGSDAGVADDHPGPWKLKTNFGLTYEFPDTKGLRSWLASREELDGYMVSADDGASFHPLTAFTQLGRGRTASTSGSRPAQPQSYGSGLNSFGSGQHSYGSGQHSTGSFKDPSGNHPTGAMGERPSQAGLDPAHSSGMHQAGPNPTTGIKGPLVNTEYRPPSRESKSKTILWLVFLLLLAAAVVIGLETFGVFKVTDVARDLGLLPAATKPLPTSGSSDGSAGNEPLVPAVDPQAFEQDQVAEAERLLRDAERLVEGNKLPAALERLATTEQIAPDNAEVHDLRARVYDKLGQDEEAAASRARADELRAAQAPALDEPNPDAPEGEPGSDDPAPDTPE